MRLIALALFACCLGCVPAWGAAAAAAGAAPGRALMVNGALAPLTAADCSEMNVEQLQATFDGLWREFYKRPKAERDEPGAETPGTLAVQIKRQILIVVQEFKNRNLHEPHAPKRPD